MNFIEILDNLVPDEFVPTRKRYISMYKKSLEFLNTIKCSRFKAHYFGSMQVGPDMFTWKPDKKNQEFYSRYQACCIYIMNTLYNKLTNKQELIEVSLSILYAMLADYMNKYDIDVDKEISDLLTENDKYVKDSDLESEFSK